MYANDVLVQYTSMQIELRNMGQIATSTFLQNLERPFQIIATNMSQPPTCQTCCHWAHYEPDRDLSKVGLCTNMFNDPSSLATPVLIKKLAEQYVEQVDEQEYDVRAALLTTFDFGCNMHSSLREANGD